MLFSRQLSLSTLIELCRTLRHYLGAGLTVKDVFNQQARKGSLKVRPVATRISGYLKRGDDLQSSLEREQGTFPPLMVSLVSVGEQSGYLPEIFAELEKYYRMQQKLWRQFYSQITWPVVQFVGAVFVIAGLIWILGMIAQSNNTEPMDVLGLGLVGTKGALSFIAGVFGILLTLFAVYLLVTRVLKQQAFVDNILLKIPALGPCLRALALSRFCMALKLTTETAMPIDQAVRLSLRATGNGAFMGCTSITDRTLKGGDTLGLAFARCRIFGEEFVTIMTVGEESGRIAEVMEHQAEHYQEVASHRLKILAQVAGWCVWLFVAILIIIAIFRIFTIAYLGPIQQGLP